MLLARVLHGMLADGPLVDVGLSVRDSFQSRGDSVFMASIHGFRMPLLSLISGFSPR